MHRVQTSLKDAALNFLQDSICLQNSLGGATPFLAIRLLWPVASAAVRSNSVVLMFLIVAPIVCGVFVFGPCFVVQYLL